MKNNSAFTLLEMAIVFSLIGLFFVFVISFMEPYYAEKVRLKNVTALQTVEDALSHYVAKHNRYPCPASPSAARGTADDGLALCSAAKGIVSADGTRDLASKVLIGAVPYRELNISADSTVDGYFNRLTYAVSQKSTDSTTYSDDDTASPGQIAPLSGQIRILSTDDPANKTSLTRINGGAHYFVFSRGRNGAGAYSEGGALRSGACPANEAENCNNDSTFVSARLAQATGNRYFDDLSKFNLDTEITDQQNSQDESTGPTQWWQLTDPASEDPRGDITNVNGGNVLVKSVEGVRYNDVKKPLMQVDGEIKIGEVNSSCLAVKGTVQNVQGQNIIRYNKTSKQLERCTSRSNGPLEWTSLKKPSCDGRIKNIPTGDPIYHSYKGPGGSHHLLASYVYPQNNRPQDWKAPPANTFTTAGTDCSTFRASTNNSRICYYRSALVEIPKDTCFLRVEYSITQTGMGWPEIFLAVDEFNPSIPSVRTYSGVNLYGASISNNFLNTTTEIYADMKTEPSISSYYSNGIYQGQGQLITEFIPMQAFFPVNWYTPQNRHNITTTMRAFIAAQQGYATMPKAYYAGYDEVSGSEFDIRVKITPIK